MTPTSHQEPLLRLDRHQEPLLRLDSVVAGYHGPVVGPVSFTIHPGQVVGLGGYNGVGKSTLLRAVTGSARVCSGSIHRHPQLLLAHQWQRPELPPELALLGRELFALLGADPAKAPARLNPLLDRPIHQLSGGQFQLVQAMACLCSPANLVLLDEPTNSLDGRSLSTLSDALRDRGGERGVVLVSHERGFLEEHCSAIVEVSE